MAHNAFDAMNNAAGDDMYITGGSILMSEYENNMDPQDQKKYETLLMDEFMASYQDDPYKGNLDFSHWLGTLNFELLRERALKFDDIKAQNNGLRRLTQMEDGRVLEDAGILQRLAHLHTGRIEDIAEIVSTMEPNRSPQQNPQFREPAGYQRPSGPPAVGE
jgi:hypothetical protein|tara:strand:- start:1185 stop:1670 length:486 start_codon:yes stop_codon:yes gene_type:complete